MVQRKSSVKLVPPLFLFTGPMTDCAVDLLPGSMLSHGLLYSVTGPEQQANKYISDSLAAELIRPSSTPAGAGFFLGKKDGGLCPCIDYCGINKIMIKNLYPLSLISAFEPLLGACVFMKLDLRNTFYLVRIHEGDEWKTSFNTPSGHY